MGCDNNSNIKVKVITITIPKRKIKPTYLKYGELVSVNVGIPAELLRIIDQIATESIMTRAEVIRELIIRGLNHDNLEV